MRREMIMVKRSRTKLAGLLTSFQLHYGPPLSFATYVLLRTTVTVLQPVLSRIITFLISTASTVITAHPAVSRLHVFRFDHGGLKRGCRAQSVKANNKLRTICLF